MYQITVAVAGFSSADLDVEVRDGQLLIVGKGTTEEQDNHFFTVVLRDALLSVVSSSPIMSK